MVRKKKLKRSEIEDILSTLMTKKGRNNAIRIIVKAGLTSDPDYTEMAIQHNIKEGYFDNAIYIAKKQGNKKRARALCEESLVFYEKRKHHFEEAFRIARKLGYVDKAEELYEKTIQDYEKKGHYILIYNLAKSYDQENRSKLYGHLAVLNKYRLFYLADPDSFIKRSKKQLKDEITKKGLENILSQLKTKKGKDIALKIIVDSGLTDNTKHLETVIQNYIKERRPALAAKIAEKQGDKKRSIALYKKAIHLLSPCLYTIKLSEKLGIDTTKLCEKAAIKFEESYFSDDDFIKKLKDKEMTKIYRNLSNLRYHGNTWGNKKKLKQSEITHILSKLKTKKGKDSAIEIFVTKKLTNNPVYVKKVVQKYTKERPLLAAEILEKQGNQKRAKKLYELAVQKECYHLRAAQITKEKLGDIKTAKKIFKKEIKYCEDTMYFEKDFIELANELGYKKEAKVLQNLRDWDVQSHPY